MKRESNFFSIALVVTVPSVITVIENRWTSPQVRSRRLQVSGDGDDVDDEEEEDDEPMDIDSAVAALSDTIRRNTAMPPPSSSGEVSGRVPRAVALRQLVSLVCLLRLQRPEAENLL